MSNRILALGVIESITFATGYAPRPNRPRVLATIGAWALMLATIGGVIALAVQ